MKKLLLFLLSFLLVHNIFSQDVPFTQRLNPNITVKGDITFVANNILNRDSRKTPNLSKRDPNTGLYSAYTGNENANIPYNSDLFRTTNGVSGFPLGNGDLYMDYIDIDDDNSTFSSSKSSLNVPSCSKVIYAGLYWSAIYPYETWDNETPRASDFNNIKFKLPGQSYQDITGEIIYDNGVTTQKPYLCYKDITSDLSALSNPNGDYYAANIKATLGIDANNGVGGTAGWVLVIIYENETESSKNISIFDGFTTVDGVHDTEISLSGFSTIPSGPVRAKILAASLEGDTFITGDNFQIRNNAGNYNNLSTPTVNQSNNFFNSSISKYDNYISTRTPEGGNTLGFDVDLFELDNVGNTIITNNQTSVDARFTTTGDSYWPFLTAIAIEINEPEIQLVETIDDNSGNNLQFVSLGNDVWYNISFQSTGSDDATNTVITKKLPNNINLIPEDLVIPTGATYTYDPPSVSNGFRGELEFTIPDNLVKKNGAIYNIRLHTQIISDCNDFKDSCSNIIESQSFINYEGIQSLIQINNRPSSSGIDACGFNIIGTSNILVDTSSCSSITEVQLCGSSIDLTAGNGFASYEWKDSAGTTIGNTQTITVTTAGTYTVNKINSGTTSAACVPFAETYNVTSSGSGTNPILAFADETLTCTNDTSLQLANFYLCGDSDSRTINTGITAPTTIKWQQLNLPSNPTPHSSCPDTNGTWVDVTSNINNPIRNFSDAGQYRLIVETSGGCFERYYFNIFKETINPTIVNQDIIASTPGSITINNVPSGYEYALVAAGAPASITYQTSNVFPISIAGDYDVYIKNASTNCVYQYLSQSIKVTNIDVTINTTPILCAGDVGLINVQINNPTSGIYNYRILSGTSLINSFGPTTDRSRDFSITNSGTYTIEITGVDNSYSFIEDIAFSSPQALEITTSTTKEINCTDGVISLSADGGTPSYNYALWSYTPAITATKTPISYVNVADISSSNFFTDANYSITSGEEGIYEFVVVDNNNCTKISSPVTITLEEPLQFTEAHTDVTCSNNGTIIVNTVTPPGLMGYILEYSIDGGVYGNSNSFSVEAGNHIVDIRTTKNGFSCNYSIGPITINSSTVLTGGSVVATNPSCNPSSNVNLGSITFTQPTGGIEPYSYLYKNSSNASFLRTTNTVITDLSSGIYDVQIEDANGCVLILPSVTIDPLPTRPILNSSVLYNCDGTGNITILSNNPNYTYTLENPFTSNNTGIFNNLSSGTYTVNIDYGSSCSEEIIVEVLDNQEFSSSIISSSNTSCNGGTDGQITITSKNFLTTYDYSIDGGTNWTNTTSTPLTITGLSVGEYTIITRAFDGNNSCEFAVGNVTIEEPETVSISNVNITKEITCAPNTGATINIIATGGVSPYEFSIDNGNTFQSDPSFTDLTAGTYSLIAKDVNGCISSYFTYIIEPSALVSFTTTGTTCYDGTNGTINVDVSSGSGGYSFSLNGGAWLFPSSLTTTSYTFEGIASGTHTIAVRDNSGCISPSTTTTINPELTATATVENNFGLDDVTIIVQGGNPPYAYSTNGGLNYQPSNSFTGLTPNSYNILVRDSNGCVTNISTNTECDQFDFRVSLIKEISCIDPDAEVELSILSGSGSYEYEVFDSSGAVIVSRTPIINTTINFPVSFSGTYTVKGYDIGNSSECSLSKNITINPVIIPEFTVSATDATCNGSATGTINVLTNAGTPPFNYDLTTLGNSTTGIWNASSNSFTNVPAGTYTVRVTGSNGCSTETNIIVNDTPYLLVPSLTATPFSCVTANNTNYATLSIDASLITGGSGIYSILDLYNDNGSAGDLNDDIKITESLINGNIHTFNIIDTNGGNYYLKVVDSNGCESFSNTVTIDPFDELLTITPVQTESISCANGGELIDINFTSRLGATGLTATISDSSGIIETITNIDSGVSITNTTRLPVGVYTIRITHPITGCELSTIYEVKDLPNYIINTNVVANVSCFGSSTGEINIDFDSSTPYTGTYTYEILEVATRTTTGITGTGIGNTNNAITGLSAGEYYVETTMTSFPFCTIITPNIVISEPASPLSLSESISGISCIGGNDGSVNVIATGGWGSYDYKIAPSFGAGAGTSPEIAFSTNNTFENLSSGNYIITVRDINGCEESNEITIIEPTQITFTITTNNNTCNSTSEGNIIVNAIGGTGVYNIELTGASNRILSGSGTLEFSNLISGNYTISVIDNNGCPSIATQSVTINQSSDLIGTFNQFTSDGIELTATGGNPPYEYSIDGINFVTTSTFSNLIPNTYNPVIRDANGCLTNLPEITTTSSLIGAFTEFTTGGIELTATGGTPPYEYSIDGIVFVDTTTFTNLPSGTYTPVIKDSVGSIFNFLPIVISNDELPIASDDTGTYTPGTQSTPINVTTNDTTGSPVDPSTIQFISGGMLTSDGKTLTIIDEGVWTVNSFGEVIFSPESGFIGSPTPIDYTVENAEGYISNTATITLINSSLIITANDDSFNVTPITTGETITPSVLDNDILNGTPVVIGSNSGEVSLNPSPTGVTNPTGLTLDFITGEITISSNTVPGSYIYTYEICENGANPTNCDIAEVTILVNDTSFNLDILPENVTCFGNSDGKIQVYINGGTPPYTCKVLDMENNPLYTKTGDNRPFTFSNMPAGEYIIEVTDSNNITDTFSSAIINQPVNNLAQSTVITNPACNGESSGQINATATGGWGSYQYQLDDRLTGVVIATYSSNNHFTNLTAGDYTLSVKDLNGCSVFSTITIEEPTALVGIANLTSSNTITISSVTGGHPPYQYSIDGGTTFTTSPIFSDLENGTYTSIIKDANDCTTSLSSIVIFSNEFPNLSDDSITTTQNTSIVIDMYANDTNIPTNGSLTTDTPTNGTIIINDPNSTPNDPSDDVLTYIPDTDFNGTDTFTYTICDNSISGNCDTATVVIIVESLEPLLITGISITDFSCEVADAIAVVNVIGGTPPYNYELSDDITGAILLNSTNNIFSNLPEGNYSIKVTDSNNNLDISQFAINTPISLEITATNSITNCNGENNGEIIVTATGGNPPYSYALNGSSLQTENIFTNLSPGTYSIDVRDVNNCTASTIITLDTPSPIISNTEIIGNTATISTTGGNPPYEYSIDAGNTFTTSSIFSNLNEGTYDVVVRDNNGCFEIFPFSIVANPIAIDDFITTIQNTSVIIPILTNDTNISLHNLLTFNQSSNGSISLDNSGTPNDISDDILIYTPNNNFIGTDEFSYTLCDVNFTNCSTASVTINVESNSFSIDVITNNATCANNNNGIIEVNVNGGTSPYNFELMDAEANTITSRTSNIFTRLLAGEYMIKVTDSNNVVETLQGIIINEPPLLTTTLTANQISCNGNADGSITIDATGGSGSYVYEISSVPGRFQSENTFTNLIPGFYEVTIQDENGCFKIMQAEINEPSVVTITSVETTSSGNQPSGFISIEATGGLPPYSYSIDGNNFIPSNEFLDLASGTYNLTAQDSNGCNSLNLTVTLNQIDIDNSVMQESDELEATYKNAASYQWINVDTKTRIPGATSSSFKPSESGRYQVEMTISESATRTVVNNKTVINNKTVSQVVLSPIVTFNIGTLSTEDIEENNFKVYPNPTTEFINLPSELLGEDYKIYTILGREVDKGKIESTKLIVESLSEGIYFLKIKKYTPVKFIKK